MLYRDLNKPLDMFPKIIEFTKQAYMGLEEAYTS